MKRTATVGDGLFGPEQKKEEERYDEDALSKVIGMHRGRLQKARAGLSASAWSYDHGRVAYTKKGALAALQAVGVRLPEKEADAYGNKTVDQALAAARLGVPAEGLEGCERLVVMRQSQNTRLVMAGMMSDPDMPFGFACRVIVGDNRNFVRGMEVMAVPVDRAQYLYRMVGSVPRTVGRW
jgi:hypothetical protein